MVCHVFVLFVSAVLFWVEDEFVDVFADLSWESEQVVLLL